VARITARYTAGDTPGGFAWRAGGDRRMMPPDTATARRMGGRE
jgi:hypothetical protein